MMPSCSIFFPCDENKNMSSHPDHDLYGHCISSSESAKHPTTMRTAVRAWQSSRDFSGSVAARRTQLDWRGNCCLQLSWVQPIPAVHQAGNSWTTLFHSLMDWAANKVEPQLWPDQFICGHQFHALKLRPNPRSKT